jgi:hypothetical protein
MMTDKFHTHMKQAEFNLNTLAKMQEEKRL